MFQMTENNEFKIGKNSFVKNDLTNIIVKGIGNKLNFGDDFIVNGSLSILVEGNDNDITIGNNLNATGQFIIIIKGNKNKINIGNDLIVVTYLNIDLNEVSDNRIIEIGDKTSFYKTDIQNYDMDSSTIIGKDCMFSYDTVIYNTDGHAIFQNGKLINQAEVCNIGDHVWIGNSATILKNCTIPDGCIVARNATVTKKFNKKNVILGGVPAKIIKEDIEWSRDTINEVIRTQREPS